MEHGAQAALAVAEQAPRYRPTPHDEVSQAAQAPPLRQKPGAQLIWQLAGPPAWPALVKTALANRLVHAAHRESDLAPQSVRYWPTAHAPALHGAHVAPSR